MKKQRGKKQRGWNDDHEHDNDADLSGILPVGKAGMAPGPSGEGPFRDRSNLRAALPVVKTLNLWGGDTRTRFYSGIRLLTPFELERNGTRT